jgi:type IV secretory pathway ATPase VirB11/archaellum biosynthesis ATPase
MKKLTEAPSPSFRIAQVSRMKKTKTEETKNKVFKPEGPKRYLIIIIKKKKIIYFSHAQKTYNNL